MSNKKKSHKSSTAKRPNNKRSAKKSITISNGPLTRNIDRKSIPSDTWVVYRGNKTERKAQMFDENLTRDEVRLAYSRENHVPFTETRSRRFRNYFGRRSNA
jgi:hypothetical protein